MSSCKVQNFMLTLFCIMNAYNLPVLNPVFSEESLDSHWFARG
jgi:hypothetical protein